MKIIWKILCVLNGAFLLFLCGGHNAPWDMSRINGSLTGETLVQIKIGSHELGVSGRSILAAALILMGGLIVTQPSASEAVRHLLRRPKRALLLILSLGYLGFTLKPTRNGLEIVLYLLIGTIGMILLMMGISPLIEKTPNSLRSFGRSLARRFREIPAWLLLVLLFSFMMITTNLSSYFIFEHIPHIQDSIDQVFHGKIFLLGRLTVPSPEPREFFDFTHMINNGKWYSEYPPGHSFLMSLGHILHAPWIINPLFGSLCAVLIYLVGREMYDELTGRIASTLMAFSPFVTFMSSEFMNHTTTLFFVELFFLGFARMMKRGGFSNAALTGFAIGYATNIRPMTAAAIAAPFAIYAVAELIRRIRTDRNGMGRLISLYLVTILVFGFMVAILLGFNYLTNGDPLLFGYEVLHGKGHNPGFGHSGWGEPHTPRKGLEQMLNNLNAINKYLLEIPIPALLFAVLIFTSSALKVWDLLLISAFSSLAFAYFFYWFQDWCFGPRFLFSSSAALILLISRGVIQMPRIFEELFGIANRDRVKRNLVIALVLCFVVGFTSNLPALVRTYSNNYWGVNADVLKAVDRMKIRNAVVFVQSYFGSVFAANSPLLDSDVIYVQDLGDEKNRAIIEKFPERKFYRANGGEITPYPISNEEVKR